ncbi:hypothetical protein [Streptomyces cavernae]|uniref:hypothetical protein n=1 Tax=Streptomyces cavernae TaxID=2259034 RepID=UPI000FEB6B7B|nr:hypothetical protein [Streptomyces cavernae]
MQEREKGPELALAPDPNPTPATASTTSTTSVVDGSDRRPGEWPDPAAAEQLREQWIREHARRELVIDSIRCHLAEQPNARAVRLCARRWIADVNYLADGVIAVLNSTETEE